jgi:hypothetical protein
VTTLHGHRFSPRQLAVPAQQRIKLLVKNTGVTNSRILLALFCVTALGVGRCTFALDKIYSPHVVKGEVELEYFGTRTFDPISSENNLQNHEISFGYGVTSWWAAELYTLLERDADQAAHVSGHQFENHFQLSKPGRYWIDPGLLVAYTRSARLGDPDTLEVKLLLQKVTGRFLNRLNIGGEQELGSHASGAPDRVVLWSTRYLLSRRLMPGLEIQSDLGKANETRTFNEQQHYFGPAAYGQLLPHLKYEVAYLFGVSNAASRAAVRLLLEYEAFF